MNTLRSLLTFILVYLFSVHDVSAQVERQLNGTVKDSTDQFIPGAHVQLVAGKDTLNGRTDDKGHFSFKGLQHQILGITIKSLGYSTYIGAITFSAEQKELNLDPVVLKPASNMLNEVEIKGKINPIKVMQDTVQYNTGAYMVRDGDYVEDLLKQLPGVEVDAEGKVTAMGKEMTVLRMNGRDFFTSDVKEFIKKLPAEMFSSLQVIDDYGKEANFTGIKVGEPRKILNLVTKPGRDKGRFGTISANAGTNNNYGLGASGNLWKEARQLGFGSNFNNTRNSAGINNHSGANLNFGNRINKKFMGNGSYSFSNSNGSGSSFSQVQTINTLGTINSINDNSSTNDNVNHNFNFNLESSIPDIYFNAAANTGLSNGSSGSINSQLQSGVIRQDIYTNNRSQQSNPNFGTNFSFGKTYPKSGRNLMMGGSAYRNGGNNTSDIITDIDFYDQLTNLKVKDSLLNRVVQNKNRNTNFQSHFSFSQPLNTPKDTVYSGIDFNYSVSMSITDNSLITNVKKNNDELRFIDSLSNAYTSTFINQTFRVGYRYFRKKINYNLGMNVQPSILSGKYEGRQDRIRQVTVNTAPSANLNYNISNRQSIGMSYNGSSSAPNFEQLQPVPDTRNLQNVVVGNPDLKTSFQHSMNINYRIFGLESGRALQIGLSGSAMQNQVTTNILLIRDTLNSLKQETRFQNVNGNYNLNSNYSVTLPFAKRKYSIHFNGNLGYSNSVLFTDNIKNFNRSTGVNQSASFSANGKWLTVSSSVNYNFNGNSYTIPGAISRDIQVIGWSANGSVRFKKTFFAAMNISKSFNTGYAQGAVNPFLINMNMNTSFLKKNLLRLSVNANDLLNQGNNLYRIVTQNTITDTRTKLVTRFFSASLSMNLENFN